MADTQRGARRIEMPSSAFTGEQFIYMQRLALALNALPKTSYTSYSSPNSNVTGAIGDRLVNLASGASVYWVKQLGSSNTGWVAVA